MRVLHFFDRRQLSPRRVTNLGRLLIQTEREKPEGTNKENKENLVWVQWKPTALSKKVNTRLCELSLAAMKRDHATL